MTLRDHELLFLVLYSVSLRRRGEASDYLPTPRRRKDTVHRAAALHKCFIKLESFMRLLLLVS